MYGNGTRIICIILSKRIENGNFHPNLILFVCVEVLRPSQPNGVMSSAVNLPNHTFTGQKKVNHKQITISSLGV